MVSYRIVSNVGNNNYVASHVSRSRQFRLRSPATSAVSASWRAVFASSSRCCCGPPSFLPSSGSGGHHRRSRSRSWLVAGSHGRVATPTRTRRLCRPAGRLSSPVGASHAWRATADASAGDPASARNWQQVGRSSCCPSPDICRRYFLFVGPPASPPSLSHPPHLTHTHSLHVSVARTRGVVLKKKWGRRLKQDLDKDLQLHRILILLYWNYLTLRFSE